MAWHETERKQAADIHKFRVTLGEGSGRRKYTVWTEGALEDAKRVAMLYESRAKRV